jgi:hypothetical protein
VITHPTLLTGFNSAAWSCDEFNGGGVNDAFSPEIILSGTVFQPLVHGPDFFDDIDIRIGGERRETTVPRELRELCVKEAA